MRPKGRHRGLQPSLLRRAERWMAGRQIRTARRRWRLAAVTAHGRMAWRKITVPWVAASHGAPTHRAGRTLTLRGVTLQIGLGTLLDVPFAALPLQRVIHGQPLR